MPFFQILIPNYNSAKWIEKGLGSIFSQTFEDFIVHVADDQSTDDSPRIIRDLIKKHPRNITIDILPEKSGYPGGTRNYLVDRYFDGEYTLFMDSDDWFYDSTCLEQIYKKAIENDIPDMIRLPFNMYISENKNTYHELNEKTIKDICVSPFIAPWTKAVKTNMLIKFPENTLFEDIPQHLAQCDICETACRVDGPIIVWNRQPTNTASVTVNTQTSENKRKLLISRFQMMADLYRLDLTHDYTRAMCESWLNVGKGWLKSEKLV